ncbi:hypothetical protein SAMN05892877_12329 [Rhizobium subbaraonis]|uniref:Uncharacterized protein n=1 Tax=Rhizobium subbaraonis TaxID=908946 RepID=A0A285UXL4_9HYPH|nr:hypothetical protein SAMN05892877_12329 [Rhizobium subbaraonis]
MMVVPALTTSCKVSEKPKNGPEIPQISTNATAPTNAVGCPAQSANRVANFANTPASACALMAHPISSPSFAPFFGVFL